MFLKIGGKWINRDKVTMIEIIVGGGSPANYYVRVHVGPQVDSSAYADDANTYSTRAAAEAVVESILNGTFGGN